MKSTKLFIRAIAAMLVGVIVSGQLMVTSVYADEGTDDSDSFSENINEDDFSECKENSDESKEFDSDVEEECLDEIFEENTAESENNKSNSESKQPDMSISEDTAVSSNEIVNSEKSNSSDEEETEFNKEDNDSTEADTCTEAQNDDEMDYWSYSCDYINPIFSGFITVDDLKKPEDRTIYEEEYQDEYSQPGYRLKSNPYNTVEAAGDYVREKMESRDESISFDYQMPSGSDDEALGAMLYSVCDEALKHTGVPTQGDYIAYQYGGWHGEIRGNRSTGVFTYTYTMTYYTTPEQEEEETEAINDLISSLDLSGKTKYERLTIIYDYICTHVTYDHDHLNDEDYTLQYTSYAALINGTAVCQGYSVLLYRMLLSSGIDCRVIAGTGNGGPHAWNIIGLSGKYYNADSTWDTSWYASDYHHWFLRAEANFENHTRKEEYTTDEFNSDYPMDTSDYVYVVPEYKNGDINGDDKVNAADRIYLARYLAGWSGYLLENEEAADVNGDNKVNAADRIYLARYLAGWSGYSVG